MSGRNQVRCASRVLSRLPLAGRRCSGTLRFHNFLPQGTAAFKRQRNAIYSFPQRIGSDRAVGSRVLPACVSLRNTLRWQSQEAARIYVAESSLPYFVPLLPLVLTVLQIFIEIESIARSFRSGKSNAFSFNHL